MVNPRVGKLGHEDLLMSWALEGLRYLHGAVICGGSVRCWVLTKYSLLIGICVSLQNLDVL